MNTTQALGTVVVIAAAIAIGAYWPEPDKPSGTWSPPCPAGMYQPPSPDPPLLTILFRLAGGVTKYVFRGDRIHTKQE